MTCEHASAVAIGNIYDVPLQVWLGGAGLLWCQSCGAVARADGHALELKGASFMRPRDDAWLKASAAQLQRDLAEARRELEETRRIWHEKAEGLQAFADTLATQLSGAVAEATRAKDAAAAAWGEGIEAAAKFAKASAFADGANGTIEGQIADGIRALAPKARGR